MAQTLSSLALFDSVKFGRFKVGSETTMPDIEWWVVDKSTSSVTLLAGDVIAQLPFDAKEPNNTVTNRKSSGNNYYKVANIRQWLNSSSASWYSAQHSYDQSPNSDSVVTGGTQYADRPGFLYYFKEKERELLIATSQTTVGSSQEGSSSYTTSDKVFLPSSDQVNADIDGKTEGSTWDAFDDDFIEEDAGEEVTEELLAEYRTCGESQQLMDNRVATSAATHYFLRTVGGTSKANLYKISIDDGSANAYASPCDGTIGIRPAITLPADTLVEYSSSDYCYHVLVGSVPSTPSSLNVPSTIKGGSSASISWGTSTDADGDSISYRLERSVNGGTYSVIYTGTARTYTDSITKGWNTVQYRVCAYDIDGDSAYSTSVKKTVSNNTAPTISGSDSNLGIIADGVSLSYTINDSDGNPVTVTEALDGTAIRSFTATLGASNTLTITGEDWLTVTNGTHTVTITARDSEGASITRTYTFTRSQYTCSVQTNPMMSASAPTRIKISVNSRTPVGSTLKVFVCNNAYDTSPAWEDATETVNNNLVYVFTNKAKTASNWGVSVKVTLDRGDAEGSCYIKAIGGNFE
jgi:hypothetical protein